MNAALDIMQRNSINRYKLDWPSFRAAAVARISKAVTTRDTYESLRATIAALDDHHSFFVEPTSGSSQSDMGEQSGVGAAIASDPAGQVLTGAIGYIWLPNFSGSGAAATAFGDQAQNVIRELDPYVRCGWIVDLRSNPGGNMWPMIAGVGPVLGEGVVGAFVDPDSNRTTWFYRGGIAGVVIAGREFVNQQVTGQAYRLLRPDPPVAVLHGKSTASSGEAVAVAFRGRPLTRSFGQPTSGLSTVNASFQLKDGAALVLTVATDVDRTGVIYGGALEPDETTARQAINPNLIQDYEAQAAIAWLKRQAAYSA